MRRHRNRLLRCSSGRVYSPGRAHAPVCHAERAITSRHRKHGHFQGVAHVSREPHAQDRASSTARDRPTRRKPMRADLQITNFHGKHATPPALRHTHVAFLHTPLLHRFRQFKRMETI
jgi:hypothetical protein